MDKANYSDVKNRLFEEDEESGIEYSDEVDYLDEQIGYSEEPEYEDKEIDHSDKYDPLDDVDYSNERIGFSEKPEYEDKEIENLDEYDNLDDSKLCSIGRRILLHISHDIPFHTSSPFHH